MSFESGTLQKIVTAPWSCAIVRMNSGFKTTRRTYDGHGSDHSLYTDVVYFSFRSFEKHGRVRERGRMEENSILFSTHLCPLGLAVNKFFRRLLFIPHRTSAGRLQNSLIGILSTTTTFINTQLKQKLIQLMGPCQYQFKNMLIKIISSMPKKKSKKIVKSLCYQERYKYIM